MMALVLFLSVSSSFSFQDVEEWIRRAESAYNTGQLEAAVQALHEACRQSPDNPALHRTLGFWALEAQQLQLAALGSLKAVELDPKDAHSLWNLGVIANQRQRSKESLEWLDKALEHLDKEPGLHQARGYALLELQRFKDAAGAFEKAVDLAPQTAEYHYLAGLALTNDLAQHGDKAKQFLEKALQLEEKHGYAHYHLGRMFLEKGETKKAVVHLRSALEFQPDLIGVYFSLGNALIRQGERDEGRDLLKTFATLEARNREISTLTRLIELRPRDVPLRLRRAKASLEAGQLDRVLEDIQATLDVEAENSEAWHLLGKVSLRQGRSPEAVKALERALQTGATNIECRLDLVRALLQRGDLDRASQELTKHSEAAAEIADYWLLKSEILLETGDKDGAQAAKEKALGLKETSPR